MIYPLPGLVAGGGGAAVDYVWEYADEINPHDYDALTSGDALAPPQDSRLFTGHFAFDFVPDFDSASWPTQVLMHSDASNRLRLLLVAGGRLELRAAGVVYTRDFSSLAGQTLTIRINHGVEIGVSVDGGAEATTAITGGETWSSRSGSTLYIGADNSGLNDALGLLYQGIGQ